MASLPASIDLPEPHRQTATRFAAAYPQQAVGESDFSSRDDGEILDKKSLGAGRVMAEEQRPGLTEHYGRYAGRLYDEAFWVRSAKAAARAVLMGEVELVCGPGTPEGCLMIQGALATSPESEIVRERLAQLRRQTEAEVARCFARFSSVGGLPVGWDPKTLAAYVMTVAAGLAVQAKSGMSRAQLTRVAEMAMLIWPEVSQ